MVKYSFRLVFLFLLFLYGCRGTIRSYSPQIKTDTKHKTFPIKPAKVVNHFNDSLYYSVFGLKDKAVTGKGFTVSLVEPANFFRVTSGVSRERYVNPLVLDEDNTLRSFTPSKNCPSSDYYQCEGEHFSHSTRVASTFGGSKTGLAKQAKIMPIIFGGTMVIYPDPKLRKYAGGNVNGKLKLTHSITDADTDSYRQQRKRRALVRYNTAFDTLFQRLYEANVLAVSNSWGDPTYWYDPDPATIQTQYDSTLGGGKIDRFYNVYKRFPFDQTHKENIRKTKFVQRFLHNTDPARIPIWLWAVGNRGQLTKAQFSVMQDYVKRHYSNASELEEKLLRPDDPRYLAGLPAIVPELQKYWLAVTAVWTVDKDGIPLQNPVSPAYNKLYNPLSCRNALGIDMRKWCIAAEGVRVSAADLDTSGVPTEPKRTFDGTSAATPTVAAGLALIYEKFNSNGNKMSKGEARDRLLRTARHETAQGKKLLNKFGQVEKTQEIEVKNFDGTPDTRKLSDTFGHGIMRLDLALKPQGRKYMVVSGNSLSTAKAVFIDGTHVFSSPAFGDGISRAFARQHGVFFDDLDSPFSTTLGSFVVSQAPDTTTLFTTTSLLQQKDTVFRLPLAKSLQYQQSIKGIVAEQNVLGFTALPTNMNTIFNNNFSLTYDMGNNVVAKTRVSNAGNAFMYSIALKHRVGNFTFIPKYATLFEKGSVLGSKTAGGLQFGTRSFTTLMGLDIQARYKGLSLYGFFTAGKTQLKGDVGPLIHSVGSMATRELGLYVRKGGFGAGITMPKQVTSAPVNISYVYKRDEKKNVFYKAARVDVRPSGRQRDMEIFYENTVGGGTVRTSLIYTIDRGHVKSATDLKVGIFYNRTF